MIGVVLGVMLISDLWIVNGGYEMGFMFIVYLSFVCFVFVGFWLYRLVVRL